MTFRNGVVSEETRGLFASQHEG